MLFSLYFIFLLHGTRVLPVDWLILSSRMKYETDLLHLKLIISFGRRVSSVVEHSSVNPKVHGIFLFENSYAEHEVTGKTYN